MSKNAKAIIITVVAVILAAAIAVGVLFGTGVIGGKDEKDEGKKSHSISSSEGDSFKDKIQINHSFVSTNYYHTVAVKNDGTVIASGASEFCEGTKEWTDIISVVAGREHIVGLKSDGTVVATGYNDHGQCDVENWSNITCIAVGNYYTLGVKKDGTVLATGQNNEGQCNVSDWTDIVTVSTSGNHTLGLKSDGTVVATGKNQHNQCEVGEWKNIIAISADSATSLGLKQDGSVVVNRSDILTYPPDPSGWNDVVSIFATSYGIMGLKSDGTILTVDNPDRSDHDISAVQGRNDIVFITSGPSIESLIGLKSDGTLVMTDDPENFQIYQEEKWVDIRTTPYKITDTVTKPTPEVDVAVPETKPAFEELTQSPVTPPSSGYVDATEDELNKLVNLSFATGNFDRYSPLDRETAALPIIGLEKIYNEFFPEPELISGTPDPLNYLADSYTGNYNYYCYDGENVDWIIRNVYGVEPNYNLCERMDWYNGIDTYAYYHDGNYYVPYLATGWGNGSPNEYDVSVNANGMYVLKVEIVDAFDDSLIGYMYVDAELKIVDGERVWSIHKIYKEYN